MARAIVGNLGGTVSKTTQYFTDLPKITAPFTTVVNRAQVTDFAADGLPKMGVDRVMIQQLSEIQSEQGPNGERVHKAVNDIHDAVRFVGGGWISVVSAFGARCDSSSTSTDYAEITFYGTGLNLVTMLFTSGQDYRVSIDGGAEGANILGGVTFSTIIGNRNYCPNTVVNVASGLTLGVHTVKIRAVSSALYIAGYETLNTAISIFLPSAQTYSSSRNLIQSTTSTTAYNSGFESGTLGTRGGHVLIYQKSDGTIAKAVTPTNTSPAYLSSADHTNEEVVRRFHWREFGAGRTDDLSSLTTAVSSKQFTLDDGTTTLTGSNIVVTGSDLLVPNTPTNYWAITFIGTGLDVVLTNTGAGTPTYEFFVDGSTAGTISSLTGTRVQKVCSGLPYGTHTVRFVHNIAGGSLFGVSQFIVYAPKTPTLPSGAIALADYFVVGNYTTTATYGNAYVMSPGVIRKMLTREAVYTGTWVGYAPDANFASGINIRTNTGASYFEFTFIGTGLEFRPYIGNATYNWTFQIDGAAPTGSTFTYQGSGLTYTPGTGVLSGTSSGAASYAGGVWSISGLTFGVHKFRVTYNSGTDFLYADAVNIITPIHAPSEVGPVRAQNVSLIGSCGIRDLRKFSELQIGEQKALCQAVGIANSTLTTPTVYVPATDMSVTIKTKGGPLFLSHSVCLSNSSGPTGVYAQFYINGVAVGTEKGITVTTATTESVSIADTISIPVPAGVYKVDVYVKNLAGNLNIDATRRNLTVYEI